MSGSPIFLPLKYYRLPTVHYEIFDSYFNLQVLESCV